MMHIEEAIRFFYLHQLMLWSVQGILYCELPNQHDFHIFLEKNMKIDFKVVVKGEQLIKALAHSAEALGKNLCSWPECLCV